MYEIDNATAATVMPTPGAVGPNPGGFFTVGNPGTGTPATVVDADWFNAVQEELANAIRGAGITLSKTNRSQLLAAIQAVPSGRLLNVQVFTASGTYTPTPGTNTIEIEVQGAGGAGGGAPATASSQTSMGGGGGAGAWAWLRQVGSIVTQTVTVGTGGVGVSGAAGGNGGASSFGAVLAANGGGGGPVAGPQATTNYYTVAGGTGGVIGATGTRKCAGLPGTVELIATNSGLQSPPVLGTSQGAGGGGAGTSNGASLAAQVGNAGQNGIVIVREYA